MGICGGSLTFAVGHFALGYLTGKGSSRYFKVKANLPLLLTASILPDIDLILGFLHHRGPTHSLITITMLMLPFFLVYRKAAVPYFAALLSHSLIGDFFTGGVELFWPLSANWYGALNIEVTSFTNVSIELILFIISLALMLRSGDLQTLLRSHNRKMVLFVAFGAVLGPMLQIGRGSEHALPTLLIIPSLFYLVVFSYSMIVSLRTAS
jgi:membrane-bound metal-dependent hydrolase YbcI (DUF457 family)